MSQQFSEEPPCGVEGCGRYKIPYGDDVPCGLSRLFRGQQIPENLQERCSATIIIDTWFREGLFDDLIPPTT